MQPELDATTSLISRIKTLSISSNGIRIIANLHSRRTPLLVEFKAFKSFLDTEIAQFKALAKSAEFYHNFSGEGFAGIDCFQGSHVSVRTYPGVNDIVFDLFLSKDLPGHEEISNTLYTKTIEFFESRIVNEKVVKC
jgi:S-adenosylmethionine/arginine decarboxylase-like enzyme